MPAVILAGPAFCKPGGAGEQQALCPARAICALLPPAPPARPLPAEKSGGDQLFEAMDATDLNKRLKDLMEGLSVKVGACSVCGWFLRCMWVWWVGLVGGKFWAWWDGQSVRGGRCLLQRAGRAELEHLGRGGGRGCRCALCGCGLQCAPPNNRALHMPPAAPRGQCPVYGVATT